MQPSECPYCPHKVDALRAKCARYEEALREIAKPLDGTPVGDPWGFYHDMQEYARKALEVPNE